MMMNLAQTQSATNLSPCANKLSESSNDFDQSSLIKKYQRLQQQYTMQQQNCLFKIESEIQKTYAFYVQMLNERRDYLLKEFYAIVQFVQSQQNLKIKQQQQQQQPKQRQDKDHESASSTDSSDFTSGDYMEMDQKNNELQMLINNYITSIGFVSNFAAIQTSVYNTFGYIRYNSSNQAAPHTELSAGSHSLASNGGQQDNHTPNGNYNKPIGPSSASSPSYNNAHADNGGCSYTHQLLNNYGGGNTEFLIEQLVNNINNGNIQKKQENWLKYLAF